LKTAEILSLSIDAVDAYVLYFQSLVSGSKSLVFSGLHNSPKSQWGRVRPDLCKMGLRVSRCKMSKV